MSRLSSYCHTSTTTSFAALKSELGLVRVAVVGMTLRGASGCLEVKASEVTVINTQRSPARDFFFFKATSSQGKPAELLNTLRS